MKVGVALGSNVGDKSQSLNRAIAFLKTIDSQLNVSSWYQSLPVDCPEGSPEFVNGFAELGVNDDANLHLMLKDFQDFEKKCGRLDLHERQVNAPRPLDLDMIYADDITLQTKDLVLPHPRAHERLFVLQGMNEICPDRVLPGQSEPVSVLCDQLKIEQPEWICQKIA